ncbi:MAG: hypothetical protein ACRENL_10750 [Candidatus Dormibacteria bacterium]
MVGAQVGGEDLVGEEAGVARVTAPQQTAAAGTEQGLDEVRLERREELTLQLPSETDV